MNATKILWGQVLLVSVVVLAFLWGATEWIAWRLASSPSSATLVRALRLAGLSAARLLLVVVRLRRLCARDLRRRRLHRGVRRDRRRRRRDRHVGLARAGGEERHDLWLGALGRDAGGSAKPACSAPTA